MATETVEPGIYHAHMDAWEVDPSLRPELIRQGFEPDDFKGHPEGFRHFEPAAHLTRKVRTPKEFKDTWHTLVSIADRFQFKGYLEGEYIKLDEVISERTYRDAPPPFKISRRTLQQELNEQFRQSEIHLTMDKDKSDPRLIRHLLEAGLYGAYLPKRDRTFIVLTIQGYTKHIFAISNAVQEYVSEVGGAVACTLKEEIVVRYKLYGITPGQLPEIADQVIIS